MFKTPISANPRLNMLIRVAQSPINANLTLIGGLNLIHLRRKIKSLIGRLILKMADLLFGLPLRQRRARIYRYNDSILICSNQKLRTHYRFGRASIEYNTNLIETKDENKLLLRSETNRPSPDSTTILCKCWLTTSSFSCRRYNWRRQVHRFTGSP